MTALNAGSQNDSCGGSGSVPPRLRWYQRPLGTASVLVLTVFLVAGGGSAVYSILSSDKRSHRHTSPAQADQVKTLPGWDEALPSRIFSGYLNVSSTKFYHYVFVESEGGDPLAAPTLLWLNGGPGCSSLDGFIYEHGPFRIDEKDWHKLVRFEETWVKHSNVIYLESPIGVGFSYSTDEKEYAKCDDDETLHDNALALTRFFDRFPAYRNNDFFIAGEAYGGVYAATLAEHLLEVADNGNVTWPPLRGLLVGNGCVGYEVGACSIKERDKYEIPYLLQTAFLPESLKGRLRAACDFLVPSPYGANCSEIIEEVYNTVGPLNMYDIYGPCDKSESASGQRHKIPIPFPSGRGGPQPCVDSKLGSRYLNQGSVKTALHVKTDLSWEWAICRTAESWSYVPTRANLPRDTYSKLVGRIGILIYNGDWDAAVPYTDSESWTSEFAASAGLVSQPWMPWFYGDGQIGGYRRDYNTASSSATFSFVIVKGGKHQVAVSAPRASQEMIEKFMGGSRPGTERLRSFSSEES